MTQIVHIEITKRSNSMTIKQIVGKTIGFGEKENTLFPFVYISSKQTPFAESNVMKEKILFLICISYLNN